RSPVVEYRVTTPGYFAAMNISMKRGADFTDRDNASGRPVVIINETMAQQFWPNGNPIGERLQLGWDPPNVSREIIGVAGDTRSQSLSAAPVPESYVPFAQAPLNGMGIVIRMESAATASILPA